MRSILQMFVLLSLSATAQGGDLLPGELAVDWGRTIVAPGAAPTVTDIIAAVRAPQPEAVAILRLHADLQNHYCPMFSNDASSLVFLRSDLDAAACKLGVFRNTFDLKATILFEEFFSFDHMPAWSSGRPALLAFSSNNSEDLQENIHLWDRQGPPRKLTSERESNVLPNLVRRNGTYELIYRHQGELRKVPLMGESLDPGTPETLGAGLEATFAPTGEKIAVIREGALTGNQLLLHDPSTGQESVLVPATGRLLRNPTWSPDGKLIAYFARPTSKQVWSLEVVQAAVGSRHKPLVEGVRVHEDFRHFGPSWGPESRKLWHVDTNSQSGYYPIRWIDAESGTKGAIQIPQTLLTAADVHCSRDPGHAAVAFVAVQERALDVYVMILNHP